MTHNIRNFFAQFNRILALTLVTGFSYAEEPRFYEGGENPLNNYRNYKSFFGKNPKPKSDQMVLTMEAEVASNYKMPNTKRKSIKTFFSASTKSKRNKNYKRPH
jgi:hypothetical protein